MRLGVIVLLALGLQASNSFLTMWLVLLVATAAVFIIGRRLDHAAWGHVPGAFRWRYASRGDRWDDATRLARPDLLWILANLMVWVVGGALLANFDGSGGHRISAAVVLGVGLYLLTAGVVREMFPGRRAAHWLLRRDLPSSGATWVAIGLVAEPSLISLWPEPLFEVLFVGVGTVVFLALFRRR